MSDLVVLAFDRQDTAEKAKQKLLQLQQQRLIIMEDIVVVVRQQDGKIKVKQERSKTKGAALGGGFWGMLIGFLFLSPLVGMAVGAGLGALVGRISDINVDEKFTREVGEVLIPGTSGLFLLIRQVTPDRVIAQMQEFRPKVVRTNLSAEQEAKLRAEFEEEEIGPQLEQPARM